MTASRRQQIIDAARELYEQKGIARTSVKDITQRCNCARSLFYHYFPDKSAITSAVLDTFIENYISQLSKWNASRVAGNSEQALKNLIPIIRESVFEKSNFRHAIDTYENAGLYNEFVDKVSSKTASYIVDTTVRDYEKLHNVKIKHVYETFYILIHGMCGFIRTHPDVDDAVLMDIIAQTLHMQRTRSMNDIKHEKGV